MTDVASAETTTTVRLGIVSTHLIQYFSPLFRELNRRVDTVDVLYLRDTSPENGRPVHDAGFGHDVTWDTDLTSGYDWDTIGLPNAPFHYSVRDYVAIYRGIRGWARRFRPDVVLVPGWTLPYLICVFALRSADVALICRPEGRRPSSTGIRRMARDLLARRFVTSMSAAAVVGSDARFELGRLGMAHEHCHESPYVVDDLWWADRAATARRDRPATRAAWGVSTDVTVYVSVGKLLPYKNPLLLLDVFADVHHQTPATHLVIVGTGDLLDDVRSRIRALGLDGSVTLLGFVNQTELPAVLVASDVFVLLSNETWGLAANEALACGLPLAVSEEAGCARDLVIDGVTGFVMPIENRSAVADKLVELADPALRVSMGDALRQVAARYTIDHAAAGIVAAAADAVHTVHGTTPTASGTRKERDR